MVISISFFLFIGMIIGDEDEEKNNYNSCFPQLTQENNLDCNNQLPQLRENNCDCNNQLPQLRENNCGCNNKFPQLVENNCGCNNKFPQLVENNCGNNKFPQLT